MSEEPVLSVSSRIKYPVLFLSFSIVILCASAVMIASQLIHPHPQAFLIVIGSYIGLLGIAMIVAFLTRHTLYIYSDHLEVISAFGKTKKIIYFNRIISWAEITKQSRSRRIWHVLFIYTENDAYKISEAGRRRYYAAIKAALTTNKPRDLEKEKAMRRRNARFGGIFFLALSLVFFYFSIVNYCDSKVPLAPSAITTISGIITNKVTIYRGEKGAKSIHIKLDTYPGFVFRISDNNAYRATHAMDYVNHVRTFDTLSLDIKTNDYQVQLTKEKQGGFWENAFALGYIDIYGLHDKNESYLTLGDYNRERSTDRFPFVMPALFGFFALGIAIINFYVIKKNKKNSIQ